MTNQPTGDLFATIEQVLSQRDSSEERLSMAGKVREMMKAAGGVPLSTSDLARVASKVWGQISRASIKEALTDLVDRDEVEFVGRELRQGTVNKTMVPIYALKKK